MPEIQFYPALPDGIFPLFSVILAKKGGKWVLARQKTRNTWEFPGGHIEPGETPEDAARRELWEKTGAVRYDLQFFCAYSVTGDPIDGVDNNFGMLYLAEIDSFDTLPPMEMAETRLFDELPQNMTYPQLQPKMAAYAERVGKWKKEKEIP